MMVAARLMTTGHWHRARVVEICYRSGITFVRVFLLDYGEYSYEIPLSGYSCSLTQIIFSLIFLNEPWYSETETVFGFEP